jgi:hypothetical protein
MISSTIALIAAGLSLASAQDPSTGNAGSATGVREPGDRRAGASAFARGVQLIGACKKATVSAVCFGGGSRQARRRCPTSCSRCSASDPAAISGKFTDAAEGAVTPLRCEFPKGFRSLNLLKIGECCTRSFAFSFFFVLIFF